MIFSLTIRRGTPGGRSAIVNESIVNEPILNESIPNESIAN
jgi:hypothetical protein